MSEFSHLLNHHTTLERELEKHPAQRLAGIPLPLRTLHDPQKCPADLLPWLAWERSVDYWSDDWDKATQRRVIAASVEVHRKKGTLHGIREAVRATGLDINIDMNRKDPGYVAHTITAEFISDAPTNQQIADAASLLDSYKPARVSVRYGFGARLAMAADATQTGAWFSCHAHDPRSPLPEVIDAPRHTTAFMGMAMTDRDSALPWMATTTTARQTCVYSHRREA